MTEVQDDKNVKEIFNYAVEYKKPYLNDVMEKVSNTIIPDFIFFIEYYYVAHFFMYLQ